MGLTTAILLQVQAFRLQNAGSLTRPLSCKLQKMKTTLITGASGGIGEAIARRLAGKKEHLVLVARNETKLSRLSQELSQQYSVKVDFITADLFDPQAPEGI
jgi:short-subunit dehydrogenase